MAEYPMTAFKELSELADEIIDNCSLAIREAAVFLDTNHKDTYSAEWLGGMRYAADLLQRTKVGE